MMNDSIRLWRLFRLLACCGLAAMSACHEHAHMVEEKGHFQATTLLRADTDITTEFVCQIRATERIEVCSLERGYLQDVCVGEGQFVEKGQVMFRVMPLVYQAEYEQAKAEAEYARIEYENIKSLGDGKVLAPPAVALAEAKLNQAKAAAELAKAHLTLTEIKAPFSGIMDRLRARRGSLLAEGDLLTSLSDNSQMWVYFNVTEAQYLDYKARYKRGETIEVKLRLANGEIFEHPGRADTIEGEFNNMTGTIAFRATFPNPERLLRHGQTGEVLVTTRYAGALLIPQKATFDVLDRKFVYVLDEEKRVRSREITIKAEKPHVFLLASGLQEGETFLVEGLRRVHEGDEVEPNVQPPEDVLATLNVPAK